MPPLPNPAFTLILISLMVGFFGDLVLQILVSRTSLGGSTGWGLKSYFQRHGRFEAMFTAAGMLGLFTALFLWLMPNLASGSWINWAIYGIVLDLIFRLTRLFPSLDGYYAHLNYVDSAIWGAIPMVLPVIITSRLMT